MKYFLCQHYGWIFRILSHIVHLLRPERWWTLPV